ncbi:MAG: 3-dehydroquinate synthase [Nakamurella sp.]
MHVATANSYDIVIGHSLNGQIIGALGGTVHVALLHPPTLRNRAGELAGALADSGVQVLDIELPDAESAKTVEVLADCWARFAAAGLDRTSVVIGMGGGTATDLAGFAAATYMRGIGLIQVPTTVLGMVDAAVGGKTGINTAAGKNMVGSFYEPRLVAADLDALATLPPDDVTAGLAEIAKCGFIADPDILRIIEADPAQVHEPSSYQLAEVIRRGVVVKADVVAADLRESSLREILNYGHTLAHAIEKREGYRWRHGNAVAVGMMFAAELARAAGRLDGVTADRHRSVLRLLGLPTTYDADALEELIGYMARDKKTRDGHLRFVVLDTLARPGRLESPGLDLLQRAYAAMNATG